MSVTHTQQSMLWLLWQLLLLLSAIAHTTTTTTTSTSTTAAAAATTTTSTAATATVSKYVQDLFSTKVMVHKLGKTTVPNDDNDNW